jgi:signal transduction histidine kinase
MVPVVVSSGGFLGMGDALSEHPCEGWLEDGKDLPNTPVNSLCRHELFMAFKEALTNVVRHSGVTEVKLGFRLERSLLVLTVADNGRGIAFEKRSRHSDGLANMRARMEKLKGEFEILSEPGTHVRGAAGWGRADAC